MTPGEDNKLLDYLPDEYNPSPSDNAFDTALKEAIQDSLDSLKPREAKILRLYYGLDSHEAISPKWKSTGVSISQVRLTSMKKSSVSGRHCQKQPVG